MKHFINHISQFKTLYLPVLVSLAFFFFKGIDYALLGSYVPLIFISVILTLFYLSFSKSIKAHRRVLKFWAVLLLVWASVRIGLRLYLYFDTDLTESHLREQFGLLQNIISVVMLVIGIGIFKQLKKNKKEPF